MYHVKFFSGADLHGLNMGTKESGADFNCTATYCYAIGKSNQAVFVRLQKGLYLACKLKGVGVPNQKVEAFADGNIGPATVALAKKLAAVLGPADLKLLMTLAKLDAAGTITIRTLATNSDQIAPELERFVQTGSPTAVGAGPLIPQPNLPTVGVTLPNVPQPTIGVQVSIPTLPETGYYAISANGQVPSSGPNITVPSPGVTVPPPPPSSNKISPAAAAGIAVVAVGLIGVIVWKLRQDQK